MEFLQKSSGDQAVTPLSKCYPSESRILYLKPYIPIQSHTFPYIGGKCVTTHILTTYPINHPRLSSIQNVFFAQHTKSHKKQTTNMLTPRSKGHILKRNNKTKNGGIYGINNITCVAKFTYNNMYKLTSSSPTHELDPPSQWIACHGSWFKQV